MRVAECKHFSFRMCAVQSFYGERFGYDFVEIIKDSNTVEKDKLDPDKVNNTCAHVCVCV